MIRQIRGTKYCCLRECWIKKMTPKMNKDFGNVQLVTTPSSKKKAWARAWNNYRKHISNSHSWNCDLKTNRALCVRIFLACAIMCYIQQMLRKNWKSQCEGNPIHIFIKKCNTQCESTGSLSLTIRTIFRGVLSPK